MLVIGLITAHYRHTSNRVPQETRSAADQNKVIEEAFRNQRSGVQVRGEGSVIRILRDDTKGSRHQRFLVRLSSGHTLLIAHNIDLAPRVAALKEGNLVKFYGEYEFNTKGGVIHWTHHDPKGRHFNGWIKHKGVSYE